MSDNVTSLPKTGVVLDLDSYERPDKEVKVPFVVTVGGREITFKDPGTIDWRDLANIEEPADLIHFSLEKEDRKHLGDTDLPVWKFNKMMEAYYEHYDLEDKIADARRQQAFRR